MATTRTLVHRYVAQRLARSELGRSSADIYRVRLSLFAESVGSRSPDRITRRCVERWVERPELQPTTKRARLSTLRGFCEWCVMNGHMHRDPTLGMRMPHVPEGLPRARPNSDVRAVLAHCPDIRARVCVLLMVQEGLRRAEVANAQVADMCLRNQTIGVRGKGGRGVVTRTLPLSDETTAAIHRYFATVGMSAGPLIRSSVQPDRGLTPSRVYQIVTGAMYAAGVKLAAHDGCSPHAFRHTMAHDMLDEGADIRAVQQMLGHQSVQTTEIYSRGHVAPNLRAAAAGRTYLHGGDVLA